MNKYEMRAEAVLKKKEEYLRRRERKLNRAVTVLASAACVAVVIAVASVLRNLISPIDIFVVPTDYPSATDGETEFTHEITVAAGYNGKKLFIYDEQKNYGEFRTCYVNEKDEKNPDNESNRFGVVDAEGRIVLSPKYDKAYAAGENCFVVERHNEGYLEAALVDKEGNIIFEYFRGSINPVFYGKTVYVLIVDTLNGNDYLIDTSGKKTLNIDFEDVSPAHTTDWDGYASDEAVRGISNGKYYLINYKGEIVHVFGEEPTVKESFGEGFSLTAAYRHYSGNYKTLLFGVNDENGEEIIPCEYPTLYFTGDRFVCRQGDEQGLGPHDVVVIYDTQGNIVCEGGKYSLVTIDYGAETGIGVDFNETVWDDDLMASVGGIWVIDKNGNKLSDEYDSIEKNPDGTYTACYDRLSKTHLLDANGKIIG